MQERVRMMMKPKGLDHLWHGICQVPKRFKPVTLEERQRQHWAVEDAKRLRAENRELLGRLNKAEDVPGVLVGLSDPLEPVSFQPLSKCGNRSGETVILMLSDLHWGETIDLGVMDGLNAFNVDIART